jgi:hypothetical protein
MQSRYTISDGDTLVVDVTVTDDGKVVVTTGGEQVKPGEEVEVQGAAAGSAGAAQYVWGATNLAERASAPPSARLETPGAAPPEAPVSDGERRVGDGLLER